MKVNKCIVKPVTRSFKAMNRTSDKLTCTKCGGIGEIKGQKCLSCNGYGWIYKI